MTSNSPGVAARVGKAITSLRNFFVNTLFILLLVVVVAAMMNSCQGIETHENAALLINPKGTIVESSALPDPFASFVPGGQQTPETELSSLLTAIEAAVEDSNIKMIVLDLDNLVWASPAHAQRLHKALTDFQTSGKKVVAYGYYFSQSQYHIASVADAIYMHPMGQVVFEGFGGFNFYIKELIDRFNINVNVYRVGDYKSAVEPFTRNDMSEESRLAAETLYLNIWQQMLADVAQQRMIAVEDIQSYADDLASAMEKTNGDLARAALEAHLVDELLTADQATVRMADDVGYADATGSEINGVDFQTYLTNRELLAPEIMSSGPKVGVIVAQGTIVSQSQDDQDAAADTLISLIRQAKQDNSIKALVLRVDSPGGSQFASEIIRQEIELLQLAGKPVVASFGSMAASGGYWISSTADAIVAEPATITGSIGIFSFIPTFEAALKDYGVHTDGVGTTSITMGMSQFTGINEPMGRILQSRVEHGYTQFLQLVARGRDMDVSEVDQIAQGRVWTGETAQQLGLVDELGGLDKALQMAADLAKLDTWSSQRIRPPVDPRAALLAELFSPNSADSEHVVTRGNTFVSTLKRSFSVLSKFDDPHNVYVLCEPCLSSQFLGQF